MPARGCGRCPLPRPPDAGDLHGESGLPGISRARRGDRLRVAVVFGGHSGEHQVSCDSAASILAHLDRRRYEVVPVRIGRDGRWSVGVDGPDPFGDGNPARVAARAGAAGPTGRDGPVRTLAAVLDRLGEVDLVFPALHGPRGEDGTLASLLQLAGVPFVGNGVLAGAVGMDKEYTRKLLAAAGLPVARGVVLRAGQDSLSPDDRARLGLPVFVKPARDGSSLGVSRVDRWDQLAAAVAVARDRDPKVLVEAALTGREIDVGVLERPDGTVEVSPPLEIHAAGHRALFDFEAKYLDAATVFDVPARLDRQVTARLGELARRAFAALDCAGLLRVDFFVAADGTATVIEVNTFPGFTAASQYPRMWQAAGIGYAELLDLLVDTALVRAGRCGRR